MEIIGVQVPTPVIAGLAFFVFNTLLILDFGAGEPIFFPWIRPFMRPFQPSHAFARLKSKYLA